MMVLSALRPDASLPEFLAHRARTTSVRRLEIDLLVALVIVAAEVWLGRDRWLPITSAAVCLGSYASWGLLDRVRTRRVVTTALAAGALEVVSAFLVALGIVGAGGLLLSLWTLALGTWIS